MVNRFAKVGLGLRAVLLAMVTGTVAIVGIAMPAHADTNKAQTFFFLDGDGGWVVVARVTGASAVGWIGIPESDATFCFRGTVKNGRLIGNSYNLIPETGDWVVDRLAVRAAGVGSRFTVTAVAVGTRPNGSWKWDSRLSRATLAQASARLGRGPARDLSSTPRACARMWTVNAGSEPQLTYLPDDPAPAPVPSATPSADPIPELSIAVHVHLPPAGEGFIEVVNNGLATINGYQIRMSPFTANVTDVWDGQLSASSGQATVTPYPFDSVIAPGQTGRRISFVSSGSSGAPSSCTAWGGPGLSSRVACTVSAA